MFGRFRRRSTVESIAAVLYGAIVAQARSPALYADFAVADTVEGRFEMVVLHTALVLRRLGTGDDVAKARGQQIFDLFCGDMDRSLRAMGIGDLGVPKRMKKIGQSFYGRLAAYDTALGEGDDAVRLVLARNVFSESEAAACPALAAYVVAAAAGLAVQPTAALCGGILHFPAVADFVKADAL